MTDKNISIGVDIGARHVSCKALDLDRGEIELRDASHLWGVDAVDTEAKLKEELKKEVIAELRAEREAERKAARDRRLLPPRARGRGRRPRSCW